MPPDADLTDILPAVHYPAGPRRERRPVPWKHVAWMVPLIAVELTVLALCARVIWAVWG